MRCNSLAQPRCETRIYTRPARLSAAGCDRQILFAVDLERHWRRLERRAEVYLPQLIERGVVESRDGTVHQGDEYETAGCGDGAAHVEPSGVAFAFGKFV